MSNDPNRRKPGLKSVHEGRQQRKTGRFARTTPKLVLFAVSSLLVIVIGYAFFAKRVLEKAKLELLAKRRAVEATLGPEWFPLRDKLEKLTLDSARNWPEDWVDSEAGRALDFRTAPGLYLRVRAADAKDAESLRKAARDSSKDGFTGCLLRTTNVAAARGEPDAGLGNEQPWNMRQAYASTRVLTDEWIREVKDAGDDLRLRVFEQQFDKATREEIPLAIEIVKRAQFFLLVLDEDAPEAAAKVDGGAITMESLQLVPHDSRVRIWNLKNGNEIARVKRRGDAGLRQISGQAIVDPEQMDAMQRQVNNCSLANRVKEALGVK